MAANLYQSFLVGSWIMILGRGASCEFMNDDLRQSFLLAELLVVSSWMMIFRRPSSCGFMMINLFAGMLRFFPGSWIELSHSSIISEFLGIHERVWKNYIISGMIQEASHESMRFASFFFRCRMSCSMWRRSWVQRDLLWQWWRVLSMTPKLGLWQKFTRKWISYFWVESFTTRFSVPNTTSKSGVWRYRSVCGIFFCKINVGTSSYWYLNPKPYHKPKV